MEDACPNLLAEAGLYCYGNEAGEKKLEILRRTWVGIHGI